MKRLYTLLGTAGLWFASSVPGSASQVLQDFDNTGFEVSYGTWIPLSSSQTLYPTYVDICNTATSNGGAGMYPMQLDISGNTDVVMLARLDPANLAATVNLVFYDFDGTEAKYTFNTSALNTATFTSLQASFSSFTLTQAGSTPGLDLAHITEWDIEGNQVGSELFAMQFDQVYVVPEPGMAPLLLGAMAGGLVWLRRRR